MFDNLKEKLGSFRKDAEEAAEENVEEVEDEEDLEDVDEAAVEAEAEAADAEEAGAAEPEAPDTTPGDDAAEVAETEADGDLEAEAAAPDSGEAAANADASSAAVEPEPESADTEAELESEPEPEPEPEPETESGSGSGSGLDLEGMIRDDEPEESAGPADAAEPDAEADAAAETEAAEAVEDDDTDTDDEAESNGSTGFGRKAKSLVKGKFVIEEEDLEDPLHELELALLSSDVEMGVVDEILDNLRDELIGETRAFTTSTGDVIEEALRDAIYDVISVGQFDFNERIAIEDKPVVIVFTGVNGVGKTTSIAKMSRYLEERGYSTVMANGDTYRAGANEQIQEHADALDTKCISHEQGGDPAAVLYDAVEYAEANDIDVVLGDTAGRLHTDEGLMDQLAKIDRVVDPDMTLFVDEAVAGQDAVNRAREFNEAAEIDGAVLTKADADSNGGAAISVAHVTGKPILFLGVGQGYDHLERFDPDEMVDRLLEDEDEE
ncbi:signal recognition particle-docking protein FtsY [Halopiger xanaduensis]|uniref:Signal recognition particle receptor FtsY n=1 Tax=Halopiger xanaduensis (strain DSM 18323 / JCM 14033 / SH-6) TaxID=797210 RepID=F8DBV8_HALXS|nr:signal recognition particle-docking protein FtsY [Halopiger xanaduensis]AEH35934.1 signal recognition particle-docking protein FtsY [Halopiger xanaduensis SH-6]